MVKEGNIKLKTKSKVDREMEITVSKKIDRKLRLKKDRSFIIKAFSLFGLVGWSVGIPVVICAYLGLWLDEKYPTTISYTLYFILFGFIAGIYNAFRWVKRENDYLDREEKKNG